MSEFNPQLCQCRKCESKLQSAYPGQFVSCECEDSFVDQTIWYSRWGGSAASVHELILEDLKVISGIGYEEDDIMDFIIDNFDTNDALHIYQAANPILGGSSMKDLVDAKRGHYVIQVLEGVIK
jgi:hypothetical protein